MSATAIIDDSDGVYCTPDATNTCGSLSILLDAPKVCVMVSSLIVESDAHVVCRDDTTDLSGDDLYDREEPPVHSYSASMYKLVIDKSTEDPSVDAS